MKRVIFLLFLLIFSLSVISDAFAEERDESTVIGSGEYGNDVTWSLTRDGILTIEGTGSMRNDEPHRVPWLVTADLENIPIKTVIIGDGITNIGANAFSSCIRLTNVSIPDSVTKIGAYAFYECSRLENLRLAAGIRDIDSNSLQKCTALQKIDVSEENPYYTSIEGILYSKDLTTLVYCPGGNRKVFRIPDSVTCISKHCFSECSQLTSLTIPESVSSIEGAIFTKDTPLRSAGPAGGDYDIQFGWKNRIPDYAFHQCVNLSSLTLPEDLTEIGDWAFCHCGLEEVTIPEGVTQIGFYAFSNCSDLKSILFLGSSPSIADMCFYLDTATAWYPPDQGWKETDMQNYDGNLTWIESGTPVFLSENALTIPVKESYSLLVSTENGTNINAVWSSSNNSAAVVNSEGIVIARKYGKSTISAAVENGRRSVSCEVQTLFWDVADPGKYYFRPVYWAAENGITKGYDLEYFAPQGECSREQIMMFLWRLADQPEPASTSSRFYDVKKGSYYYKAVLWGVEQGITNGFSTGPYAGKFGVGLPCTREQAMTFLWRMSGMPSPASSVNKFTDVEPGDYFFKAVLWAFENGIAKGYSDGTYGVNQNCLREHIVTFLSRYSDSVAN